MTERIIIGMSGGVDSAVSALLLKEQGYDLECVFMKNWVEDSPYCTTEQDYKDALLVCDHLGLKLNTVNFNKIYRAKVFDQFLKEYAAGHTPNPDTLCNKEIKFNAFLDFALRMGGTRIATGHFVRISKRNGTISLRKGVDQNKDQSYFLYMLNQAQLEKSLFPVGPMTKGEVRALAKEKGLPNHDRKDSTGICFIGERDFGEFLRQYFNADPGDMITPKGKIVGKHEGLMFYTIGQRRGLGIGGGYGDKKEPWFVIDKIINKNILIVGQGQDHPALYNQHITVRDLHWVSDAAPEVKYMSAKIRYRQADQYCSVKIQDGGAEVEFAKPQFAAAPGQAAVFYDGDVCLGGGTIETRN